MSRDTQDDAGLAKLTGLLIIGGVSATLATGSVAFWIPLLAGIGVGLWLTSTI